MTELQDGWIEWGGGPCPVSPDTIVQVRFRGYPDSPGEPAWVHDDAIPHFSCWRHAANEPDTADIIAYRVLPA